jgi:hypothetical protein
LFNFESVAAATATTTTTTITTTNANALTFFSHSLCTLSFYHKPEQQKIILSTIEGNKHNFEETFWNFFCGYAYYSAKLQRTKKSKSKKNISIMCEQEFAFLTNHQTYIVHII